MIILRPAHEGQYRGRCRQAQKAPEIDFSQRRMAPATFAGQHRTGAGNRRGDAERDVEPDHHGEKDWIGGGISIPRMVVEPSIPRVSHPFSRPEAYPIAPLEDSPSGLARC
jgi:hypothetical protein